MLLVEYRILTIEYYKKNLMTHYPKPNIELLSFTHILNVSFLFYYKSNTIIFSRKTMGKY